MDWKSIGSKKRKMKFFTQISSSPFQYWVSPYDAPDTLEPFHRLSCQYSKLHNQQPKNDCPNISVSIEEIQLEEVEKFALSISSQSYLRSSMVDIQYACEHDLYLQPPLKFEYSHYYKSELANPSFFVEYHLVKHDNDILSPKQGEQTSYLRYDLLFDNRPYCKSIKFIETKVAAMKLQGFNH